MNRIDRLFGIATLLQSKKYVPAELLAAHEHGNAAGAQAQQQGIGGVGPAQVLVIGVAPELEQKTPLRTPCWRKQLTVGNVVRANEVRVTYCFYTAYVKCCW